MSLALSTQKTEDLPAKVAQQQAQIRWLELRVKDLETRLFGKKSEKRSGSASLKCDSVLAGCKSDSPVVGHRVTPGPPTIIKVIFSFVQNNGTRRRGL